MLDDQRAALFTCYHRTSRSSETKEGNDDEKKEEDNSFNEAEGRIKVRCFIRASARFKRAV